MDLHFTMYGRDIKFSLDYDENFAADRNMLYCLRHGNACEPEVMHLMARVLRPGDFAVDGGANIGFFSLFMAQLVGPTGSVLACEPAPANQYKLETNIKMNKAMISTDYRPLYDSSDTLVTLHVAEDSGVNSLYPNDRTIGTVHCRSVTLWHLLESTIPRLIKLDIEGAEERALAGLGPLLGEVPYIVCEINEAALNRFGSGQKSLRSFMGQYYYETFVLTPQGILPVHVPSATTIVTGKVNLNVLFSTVENVAAAFPTLDING